MGDTKYDPKGCQCTDPTHHHCPLCRTLYSRHLVAGLLRYFRLNQVPLPSAAALDTPTHPPDPVKTCGRLAELGMRRAVPLARTPRPPPNSVHPLLEGMVLVGGWVDWRMHEVRGQTVSDEGSHGVQIGVDRYDLGGEVLGAVGQGISTGLLSLWIGG